MQHGTPTLMERVDTDAKISRVIGGFLAGYPNANTRDRYSLGLRQWVTWCASFDVDPLDADATHVELWLRDLEARGLEPKTVCLKFTPLNMLYGWMVARGLIVRNPMDSVRRPKPPRLKPMPYLKRQEMATWLDAAQALAGYRYSMACLLAYNALRVSEACNLDVESLGGERWHPTVLIHGKGGTVEREVVNPRTMQAIEAALDGRGTGPLLLNQYGNRLTPANARAAVTRIAQVAGIRKRVTPHALRRSAITAALNAGVTLRDVQRLARHATPSMTMLYDQEGRSMDRSPVYTLQTWLATG